MRQLISALVLLVGGCSLFSQSLPMQTQEAISKDPIPVQVIDNVPVDNTYDWNVSGSAYTRCSGYSCASFYNPAQGGTARAEGAVLKLLMPDGRIVIAECEMKPNNAANFANALAAMNGQYASPIYRDCRTPPSDAMILAKFKGSNVKLYMQLASLDGHGKKYSETYVIRGVLLPSR